MFQIFEAVIWRLKTATLEALWLRSLEAKHRFLRSFSGRWSPMALHFFCVFFVFFCASTHGISAPNNDPTQVTLFRQLRILVGTFIASLGRVVQKKEFFNLVLLKEVVFFSSFFCFPLVF